jgi:hypothetical protein
MCLFIYFKFVNNLGQEKFPALNYQSNSILVLGQGLGKQSSQPNVQVVPTEITVLSLLKTLSNEKKKKKKMKSNKIEILFFFKYGNKSPNSISISK